MRKKYILSDANYFNKKCKKRKIILTNSLTSDMRFFEGWKLRRNGNYKKVTHYTIDKDGTIHEHFNPEYYSDAVEDGGEGIYISSNSSSHDVMIQPTYTEGDLIFGRRTGVEPANFEGLKIEAGGNVGINDNSPDNQLHVTNASGVQKAVVKLEQLDNNEPFFRFQGTSASDGSRSISSDTAKSSDKAGAIMVNINGTDRWIWFYDNYGPSSP